MAEAAALAETHFGVTGELTALTSERDLNFRLTTPQGRYVLKLANASEPPALTDLQTLALLHLEASPLPDPPRDPHPSRRDRGADPARHPAPADLSGGASRSTCRRARRTNAPQMATTAARLTLGLQGFTHPAADHFLQWDIKQAATLRPLLPHIAADLRPLATEVLNRFDRDVAPHLPTLRAQIVHNDLNPHNVLVDPANPDQITGILDFGDMVLTPLICDAAVAASYQIDPAAPWQSLQTFAAAYHATLPLTAARGAPAARPHRHTDADHAGHRLCPRRPLSGQRALYPAQRPRRRRRATGPRRRPPHRIGAAMTQPLPWSTPTNPGKGNLSAEDEARIARRTRLLGPAYRLFYETPVHLVRGEGVWLYDAEGQAYLDCYNNVASVGHCHPHVVAATARQSAIYASHTRYLNDTVLDYAERLLATFPARAEPCDVHLHRVRGERSGPAHRLRPYRRHRGDRDRERLSRCHAGHLGHVALASAPG